MPAASFTITTALQSRSGASALPALTVPGSFVGSSGYFLFVFGANLTGFSDSRQGAYELVFDAGPLKCYAVYAANVYQVTDTFQASSDTIEWNMFVCTGFKTGETTLAGILDRVATDTGSLAATDSDSFSAVGGNTRWSFERIISAVGGTGGAGGGVSVSGGPGASFSANDGTTYGEHAVDDNDDSGSGVSTVTYTGTITAGATDCDWGVGVFSIIGADSSPFGGIGPGGANEDANRIDWDRGPSGQLLRAWIDASDALKVDTFDDAFPEAVSSTATVEASGCASCRIFALNHGRWLLLYLQAGAAKYRTSSDDGATWSVATSLGSTYTAVDGWVDGELGLWVIPLYVEASSRWDYKVVEFDSAGAVGTPSAARTLVSSAKGAGRLQREPSGIWAFHYITTAGAASIVRCRNLDTAIGTFS